MIGLSKLNYRFYAFVLRTTALFIKDHPKFCFGKRSNWLSKWDLLCNLTTLWWKKTTNWWSLLMLCVKSVSKHEEASAGGGSFSRPGGLNAQQNLAICISRNTCHAIVTNFSSGWFYQNHRWSLINNFWSI